MYKLMPLLAIGLVACHETGPESLLAPDQVSEQETKDGIVFETEDGHAFETEGIMTNFMILPAQALGLTASDFWGRCGEPAVWLSVFQIEGRIPQVGDVRGSASHCAYKENPVDPLELPTYEDGQGWLRSANGDDIYLEYGNGSTFPVEGGLVAFRDEWTFVGGTGRLLNVTGSGIDYGEYDPADVVDPAPGLRFPYLMSGRVDYDAGEPRPGGDFRGTFHIEMSMPYLMAGNLEEDPCLSEQGAGWITTFMEGRGTATHLGPFTTHAEYCSNMELGQTTPRIHEGTTASGAAFSMLCEDLVFDLPFFVPGLDRVYSFRSEEALTGLSGPLEGASADIHSVGRGWIRWQQIGGDWIPDFPWAIDMEMAGAYRR